MHRAVSDCPKVNLGLLGLVVPSLLDSGSQVTFIRESYFKQHIQPLITSFKGEKALAHTIFHLKGAGEATLPVMKYLELDIDLLGMVVPKVGVLIVEDPNNFIRDPQHHTKLPGVVGWNLIKHAYLEFVNQYGSEKFEKFECPSGIHPLLFSQLSVYHYTEQKKAGGHADSERWNNAISQVNIETAEIFEHSADKKKLQKNNISLEGYLG